MYKQNFFKHFSSFCSFGTIQAVQILLPLLALPYLTRVLNPDNFGVLMYFLAFSATLSVFQEWGFNLSAVRALAKARGNRAEIGEISAGVLSAKIILSVGIIFISIPLFFVLPHASGAVLGFALAVAYAIVFGFNPLWFFQGLGVGVPRMALFDLLGGGLVLILTFLFIKKPEQWSNYLLFLFVIKGIIYFGINFWIARCYAKNKMRVAAGIKALREAGVLFVSRLASMLYTNCSILIFGLFLSATQIGALVLAEKVARAFASLVGPLNQTFFPEACASVSAGQEQKNTLVGVSFWLTFGLMGLATLCMFVFAPELVRLAYGQSLPDAVFALRVLCLLPPLLGCNLVLATQVLLPHNYEKQLAKLLFCVALLAIPCTFGLGYCFGLHGAAWLSVLVEGCIFLGLLCYSRKISPAILVLSWPELKTCLKK